MARMPRASRESVAYQETYQKQPQQQPQVQQAPLRVIRPHKRTMRLPQIMCLVLVAGVAGLLVCNQMRLTELTTEVANHEESLQTLQDEYVSLKTRQDRELNLTYVEEYAQNILGMVKMDSNSVEYIEMNNPDCIEVSDNTDGILAKISKYAAAVKAYLQ